MTPDRYTKAVLTVIALCLVWLCVALSGPSFIPGVAAQQETTEVVIVGWRDTAGETWRLPTIQYLPSENSGLLSSERTQQIARLRRAGLRLPVDGD
jgi:hypothetical protein